MMTSYAEYPAYQPPVADWQEPVPLGWKSIALGRLFRRTKRTGFSNEELLSVYRDYGVILKSSRDDNYNKASEDLSPYQLVCPGDLVMNKMKAWQGSIAISEHRGIVSPAYFVYEACRPEDDRLHSRYIHYLVRSPAYVAQYLRRSKGIRVNQWDLDPGAFERIEALLPSLSEQTQIAKFLDCEMVKIDALIEKQQQLIALLKEKRQAVISRAVTKGLDPNAPMRDSGVEWLGEIPAHWEVRKLKRIADKLQGRLIVQPHLYFADEGVPIVFGYNIKNGRIDESNLSLIDHSTDRRHAHAKAKAGDVYTVRLGDPGATAVVPSSLDGCHYASIMWIHQNPRFSSEWLSQCMNSDVVQRQIESVNYGAAQTQFNISDAVNFVLPFPPLVEQERIAKYLEEGSLASDSLVARAEELSRLLHERRISLISAAVTGKIDVRDWTLPSPTDTTEVP